MKLDEKYFVPFLAVVAIGAALLILFFTVNNQQGREQRFKEHLAEQDSIKYQPMPIINSQDSLGVTSFPDQYVVVDFWATWTESFSLGAHEQLKELKQNFPDNVEVLAAVVEDKSSNIEEYINRYEFPFRYVDGTHVFNKFGVPGVPTQLVYRPGGKLQAVFTGYADSTRKDSLQAIFENEQ